MTLFAQRRFSVRVGWGPAGARRLAPDSDAIVIVDVLSSATALDVACSAGARVTLVARRDEAAARLARERGAVLAHRRGEGEPSLSPSTFARVAPGARFVLAAPNGGGVSEALAAVPTPVYAGCLRNATAVARAAAAHGPRVSIVAAGERWEEDGSLRPALEDWLGAGAIARHLGARSPEADAAVAAFAGAEPRLRDVVRACEGGEELIEGGWGADVDAAAALDVSPCAPRRIDGEFAA